MRLIKFWWCAQHFLEKYLLEETEEELGFSEALLKTAIIYVIENCYFNFGKVTMKQVIGIPMVIDVAPFLAFFYILMKKNACHH